MNQKLIKAFICVAIAFLFPYVSNAQIDWKPKYAGEIHMGYGTTSSAQGFDTYLGRVMLGTTHGVAFGKYGDVGLGFDAVMFTHYYKNQGLRFAINPYFSVRPTYPITNSFSVFLDCAIGASVPVVNMTGDTEFLYQFGPGIKLKRFNCTLGIQNIGTGEGSTTFFTKVGIILGKL